MMGFHLLGPYTQESMQASMFFVVSILYVLGTLAKTNFKVYEQAITHHFHARSEFNKV
jgi:hypothetical protein